MHVVTVSFRIEPAHREAFLREMRRNAAMSLELEPGCRQFDVCVSLQDDCSIFLYELYDNRQAFELHLASRHFLAFSAATASWIASKEVGEFSR